MFSNILEPRWYTLNKEKVRQDAERQTSIPGLTSGFGSKQIKKDTDFNNKNIIFVIKITKPLSTHIQCSYNMYWSS